MDLKIASVMLTAGWGDGSVTSMNGLVDDEQLKKLKGLESEFPELLTVTTTAELPVSADLVDYVRWWVCGGADELHERLFDMDIIDFAKNVRREIAPPGYRGADCESCDDTQVIIRNGDREPCPLCR